MLKYIIKVILPYFSDFTRVLNDNTEDSVIRNIS